MKESKPNRIFWIFTLLYWLYFLSSAIYHGYSAGLQYQNEGISFSTGVILGAGLTLAKGIGFYLGIIFFWRPWKKKKIKR